MSCTLAQIALPTPSTICETSLRTDSRRASLAALAKGMTRHIPDMRMFAPQGTPTDEKEVQSRRQSRDIAFLEDNKKHRKVSIALPSAMKPRKRSEPSHQSSILIEAPSEPNEIAIATQTLAKGSLRDRRKVKLDLSLPTEIPDLPLRNRPPPP